MSRKWWGAVAAAAALLAVMSFRIVPVLVWDHGTLRQDAHWIVYGYDRVWYRNRAYSDRQAVRCGTLTELGPLRPSGATVIGMPVLNAWSPNVPTVLVLSAGQGSCVVYSLLGGP